MKKIIPYVIIIGAVMLIFSVTWGAWLLTPEQMRKIRGGGGDDYQPVVAVAKVNGGNSTYWGLNTTPWPCFNGLDSYGIPGVPEEDFVYKWNMGNGNNVTAAWFSYGGYNSTGVYTATLNVTVDDPGFPAPPYCDEDSVQVTVFDVEITSFTAGRTPYNSSPKITTFITNTETSCNIDATAEEHPDTSSPDVDWDVTVPSGWSCSDQETSLTFDRTATLPTHPDGGRPSGMQIQLKATFTKGGVSCEDTVTATQSATDRIRQMYVDHNIKVPTRDEFNGGTSIPLRSCVTEGHSDIESDYSTWCGSSQSLSIYSGYRNPEHNEDEEGHEHSMHMYGYAIDMSPIDDHGPDGGDGDPGTDCDYIMERAEAHGAVYTYTYANDNAVHAQWLRYVNY